MNARIAAVILAAGGSSRFGSPKQLLAIDGRQLVRRGAQVAREAGANPVIVVLGANSDDVARSLDGLDWIHVAINSEWKLGQSGSLRIGLRALETDVDGVLIMLADQPAIGSDSLHRLTARFDTEHRIVASEYDSILGAPALFGVEHVPDLMTLTGDAGAGKWLRNHASVVTRVPMPEGAIDIDTPADADAFRATRSVG